jgi:nucleoid DNA-binding protein
MAGLKDIAKEAGLNPLKVEGGASVNTLALIEEMFKLIIEKCAAGEKVRIKDFGTFGARLNKGRKLKTPLMEGGEVKFGDILLLKFRQSGTSKKQLNADGRVEEWGGTYVEKPPRPSDIKRAEKAAKKKAERDEAKKKKEADKAEKKDAASKKDGKKSKKGADAKDGGKKSKKGSTSKTDAPKTDGKKSKKDLTPKDNGEKKDGGKKDGKKSKKSAPPKDAGKDAAPKKDGKKKSKKSVPPKPGEES